MEKILNLMKRMYSMTKYHSVGEFNKNVIENNSSIIMENKFSIIIILLLDVLNMIMCKFSRGMMSLDFYSSISMCVLYFFLYGYINMNIYRRIHRELDFNEKIIYIVLFVHFQIIVQMYIVICPYILFVPSGFIYSLVANSFLKYILKEN